MDISHPDDEDLVCSFEIEQGVATITGPPEVDQHTAPFFEQVAVEVMSRDDVATLVYDASTARFIDACGVGVLVRLRDRAEVTEKKLILADLSRVTKRVLEVTGLIELFEVSDSGTVNN